MELPHHAAAGSDSREPTAVVPAAESVEVESLKRELLAERAQRREAEAALQLREQELADFVENAVEGLHKVDGNGIILWANRAELLMLGYPRDEYVGRSITEFHVDQPVIEDILRRLLAGEAIYDYPARLRCKDGTVKHVSIHSNGCFRDGRLQYTRCYTRDATLVQERERLVRELGEAGRAKDEFLAMLGHELRNPLAPIVTALGLMRLRGDAKTSHEQRVIERQVSHMVRLVDDLLDVSRITSGKIELRSAEVALPEVLVEAVEMAGILLEQRQHRLLLDVDPKLRWFGDGARLAQVVSNLLTNAARYTPVGGEIQLRAWQSTPTEIAISVRDNGQGIAADQLENLFELFYQVRQSLDRPEGGLGIGLALVKSLVEMHGGTVHVHSEGLGRGSEFNVRLPIIQVAPVQGAGERVSPNAERASQAEGIRLAVVDDNADNADVLGELLAAEGFDVEVFHDPIVALRRFTEELPDIAILDIGLPVMDGHALAKEIHGLAGDRPCKLIALSGYGQRHDRERSAEHFELHLVKPVEPDALLRAVRSVIRPAS